MNFDSIHRSHVSEKIKTPVQGNDNLAVNLIATAWNENPELRAAATLGTAKIAAKKWARTLAIT